MLIVRDEPEGIRRYVHIGTGNYHTGTARLYTDLVCSRAIRCCARMLPICTIT